MNRSLDKAGNMTYTPRGYTDPFFSKGAASHAEWLVRELTTAKKRHGWKVMVYGGSVEYCIPCKTYVEALQERDVRGGMGYVIEIVEVNQ